MPHPLCTPEQCGANLRHRTNAEGIVVLAHCLYHGTVVLPGYEQYVMSHCEGGSNEKGERRDYISYRYCRVCKGKLNIMAGKGRIRYYHPECGVQRNRDNARERARRIVKGGNESDKSLG